MKLYDVASAAERIGPMLAPGHGRGGAAERHRRARHPPPGPSAASRVLAGSVYIRARIAEPGVVAHEGRFARVVFGELDGRRSGRAEALLRAFRDAGVDAEIADDVEAALWTKFVLLSAVSATNAITRGPTPPVLRDPDMRRMFTDAMRETEAVARARGVDLAPDIVARQLRMAEAFPPDAKASLLQDLEAGKRLEVAYLSGAVSPARRRARGADPGARDDLRRAEAVHERPPPHSFLTPTLSLPFPGRGNPSGTAAPPMVPLSRLRERDRVRVSGVDGGAATRPPSPAAGSARARNARMRSRFALTPSGPCTRRPRRDSAATSRSSVLLETRA